MKTTTNEHGTTIAIGEEVQAGLITVIVTEGKMCAGCAFKDVDCGDGISLVVGNCIKLIRTDNKNVIFKLKK